MSFTYSHGHQVPWDQYQTDIVKKNKEIAQLKEDARTNLGYSLKYEKDLVKKNEEIALLKAEIEKGQKGWWEFNAEVRMRENLQKYGKKWELEKDELKAENEKLKAEIEKLKDEDKCVMDMLEPAIKEEVALLKEKNEELKILTKWLGMDGGYDKLKAENEKLKAKEKSNTGWLKLTQDNAELKADNTELQDRLDKIQEWMSKEQRAFGSGAVNSFWNAFNEQEEDEDSEEDSCGCGLTDNCYCDEDSGEEWDEDFEKEQMSAMVKEVKVGEGDVGWEKY